MAYITSDQLTTYDTKIKQYIQAQINSATATYKAQIASLNYTVQELTKKLNELESNINSGATISAVKETESTATPMLRSLSKGLTVTDINGNEIINDEENGEEISVRSIKPQTIIVEEDIEEDYVIYDRIISPNENAQYRNIVVTSDDKSNRVWFSIWKTFDDRDLTNKEISVIWVNADGGKGESLCVDKAVSGDRLYFAWNIPGLATYKAGTITYAIRITDGPDYAWHTLPATIECVQGLMDETWDELEPAEETPGWVDYIEGKYKVSIQIMDEDEYTELPEYDDEVVYVVNMNDDTVNMYLGDKQISGGGGGGTSANFVELTSAEYTALGDNVDPDTLYLLTD